MQAGLEGVAQETRQVRLRPPRSWGLGQAPHHQPVAGAGQVIPSTSLALTQCSVQTNTKVPLE